MIRHARLAPGPVSATAWMAPGGACAIALLLIVSDEPSELDAWLQQCGLGPIAPGRTRLVDALGIDEAVLARPTPRTLHLMPHGGQACLQGLTAALEATGVQGTTIGAIEPDLLYPAARTPRQALAMALLALAASPMAIDVLAMQGAMNEPDDAHAATADELIPLHHLLFPPTVAIVGGANIGKSTLLNALARRRAAIVADEPGTTRDHLGVSLVLDGLAVRWLDTPGQRSLDPANSPADAVEAEARATADRAIAKADLIILAADHDEPFPEWPSPIAPEHIPALRVRLRCDRTQMLGEPDPRNPEIHLAIPPPPTPPTGLTALAKAIRLAFVPDPWLDWASREPLPLSESALALGFARGAAPR